MRPLVLAGRLVFGAWMLANGINHFFFPLWSTPTGSEPLAIQLMSAFVHSGLFDIAMAIQLVTGALILSGFFVPVALCVVMPVSTCALYWSMVLEREPLGAALALVAFALNGLLMLAYIAYYREVLQRRALTLGESSTGENIFDALFVKPGGRTSRGEFVPALITLLAAVVFYVFIVKGRTAQWCLLVLLFPAIVLHARRLRDMGHATWPLLFPAALMIGAFATWLDITSLGARLDTVVPLAALAISAGFALWGCIGAGQPAASRPG
jgi:uncharacterized membrane protein YhaH (DUF805 family)